MPPADRLRLADEMSSDVRAIAEAGIRARRPGASPAEIADELAIRLLGRDVANDRRRVQSTHRT